jgi:hypothetical protein
VIHIQHDGAKGHPLETNTKGWEIHPLLKPADGERVIRKRESDSFFEIRFGPRRSSCAEQRTYGSFDLGRLPSAVGPPPVAMISNPLHFSGCL